MGRLFAASTKIYRHYRRRPRAVAPKPLLRHLRLAYSTWKPGFYPADAPSRAFLHVYASRLTSVEVNYTFGSELKPGQLQGWLDATPPGFQFSFKAPQSITHFKRLRDCHEAVAAFVTSLEPARDANKLGPLLFQLPPSFKANNDLLAALLQAPALHRKPLKVAFEFRNTTCFTGDTYNILREHNAALCIAESDDLATPEVHTANFFCFRLRRNGGYKPNEIKAFARRFTQLSKQGQTFAYFKHEDKPTGALNAESMLRTAAKLAGVR